MKNISRDLYAETALALQNAIGNADFFNGSSVIHRIRFPADWHSRWPQFHHHVTGYRRLYRANRWHDAADVLTGIIEKEAARAKPKPHSRLLL